LSQPRTDPAEIGVALQEASAAPARVSDHAEPSRVARLGRPFVRLFSGRLLGLLFQLMLFGVWWLITADGLNIIRPLKFPTPRMVGRVFVDSPALLLNGTEWTVGRVVVGLAIGATGGVLIGLLMSRFKTAYNILDPQIESMRPIPPLAAIPFFILWFGIGETGKFLLIATGVFMIMVVTTVEAAHHVSPIYVRAALSLGAPKGRIYRTVIFPAILPPLVAGLRVSAAAAFGLVVAAEFMGAQKGLGYLVMNASRTLDTGMILTAMIILGLSSFVLDKLIRLLAAYLTRWAETTT
jgi:ABC-type nitrate/sulfonate/bicarbonate transport system permease component